jgi:hypothetical protein
MLKSVKEGRLFMVDETIELLRELSEAPGVSGYEQEVR